MTFALAPDSAIGVTVGPGESSFAMLETSLDSSRVGSSTAQANRDFPVLLGSILSF